MSVLPQHVCLCVHVCVCVMSMQLVFILAKSIIFIIICTSHEVFLHACTHFRIHSLQHESIFLYIPFDLLRCTKLEWTVCLFSSSFRFCLSFFSCRVPAVCEKFVEDVDVAEYYQPLQVDGKIRCVTVCHSQHSNHKRCYNKGICIVYKATGPLCK